MEQGSPLFRRILLGRVKGPSNVGLGDDGDPAVVLELAPQILRLDVTSREPQVGLPDLNTRGLGSLGDGLTHRVRGGDWVGDQPALQAIAGRHAHPGNLHRSVGSLPAQDGADLGRTQVYGCTIVVLNHPPPLAVGPAGRRRDRAGAVPIAIETPLSRLGNAFMSLRSSPSLAGPSRSTLLSRAGWLVHRFIRFAPPRAAGRFGCADSRPPPSGWA